MRTTRDAVAAGAGIGQRVPAAGVESPAATVPPRRRKQHPHGNENRYLYNRCRCVDCREAHRVTAAARRRAIAYGRWAGHLDPTGTVRRIRALSTVGWSCLIVAREMGVDAGFLREIARGERQRVHANTAGAVARIYDEWCTGDGPSRQAIGWARKKGWLGPEAWSDETIDDPAAEPYADVRDLVDEERVTRALRGFRTELTDAELVATIRAGVDRGHTFTRMCSDLSVNRTKASRLLAEAAAREALAEDQVKAA
jgi:hypothetical protein